MPCFFAICNGVCFDLNLWPLTACMTFWLLIFLKDTQKSCFQSKHGLCLKSWIDLRQLQDGSVKPNENWELHQGWNTPQTSLKEIPTWAKTWHSPPGHSPTKRIHTAVIIESEEHTILRLLYRDAYGSSWLSKVGQSHTVLSRVSRMPHHIWCDIDMAPGASSRCPDHSCISAELDRPSVWSAA